MSLSPALNQLWAVWHRRARNRSLKNEGSRWAHKGAVYITAKLLCFLAGSSSANSSPEFSRKDYGNYCKLTTLWTPAE